MNITVALDHPVLLLLVLLTGLLGVVVEWPVVWAGGVSRTAASRRDVTTTLATALVVLLAVLVPTGQLGLQGPPALVVSWIGLVLGIVGLAVRLAAVHTLGRWFSPRLEIVTGQTLVRSGPYRYLRHPGYTGALLLLFGLVLVIGNWPCLAATGVLALAVRRRATHEEDLLREAFGNAYALFESEVPRFIPLALVPRRRAVAGERR